MRTAIRITDEAMVEVQKRPGPRHPSDRFVGKLFAPRLRAGGHCQHARADLAGDAAEQGRGVWTTHGDLALPLLTTERELAEGDVLWTDVSITYQGYRSDFGRTWIVGRDPSAAQQAQFDKWFGIMSAVLGVAKAGATAADLGRAAIKANGGTKPWLPHFYLGHGIGVNARRNADDRNRSRRRSSTRISSLQSGMVLVLEPVVWEDGTGGYRSEEVLVITEEGWIRLTDYPYDPYGTDVLPDERRCATGAPAGAGARWRHTTSTSWYSAGKPMSVTSPVRRSCGSRAPGPFGPTCVVVRETGAVHLLSTWDEGVPDDIPHENLYGISWNPMNTMSALQRIDGAATARRVGTDALSPVFAQLLPTAFPNAQLVDGELRCGPPAVSRRPRRSPRCGMPSRWPNRHWRRRSGVAAGGNRTSAGRCRAGGLGGRRREHPVESRRRMGDLAHAPVAPRRG